MTDTVETDEELDYTYPLGQPPTPLQDRFATWLMSDAVGYAPSAAKTKEEAFREGVRLGVALRIPYQASEHNKQATAMEREAREAARQEALEAREAERLKREEARNAKAAAKAAKAQEKAVEEEQPAAKPAKATKTAKGKAAPASTPAATPAPTRQAPRRAPARRPAAAATTGEAPF